MAAILDKKQDVISFKLTSYGRGLLGSGQFTPAYMRFFDSNVIYDVGYGGDSEEQNESQPRILGETLTFEPISSAEYVLNRPLGKASRSTDYAPAWSISLLSGQQTYIEASSSYFSKRFELNDIKYTYEIAEADQMFFQGENLSAFELDDGRMVEIGDDYLLFDISEVNSDDENENFEIELYVENINTGTHRLRTPLTLATDGLFMDQLSFYERQNNVIDGLIYEDSELPAKYRKINLGSGDAEYFLDILVDDEIDTALIEGRIKTITDMVKGTYSTNVIGPVKDDC